MGRTTTPKYRVEFSVTGACYTPAVWRVTGNGPNVPGYGAPTRENLEAYMRKFEDSLKPGGCNHHLVNVADDWNYRGVMPYYAKIVRQEDGALMAVWYDYSYQ